MKEIPGYNGQYLATEDGRIWSIKKQDFMTPYADQKGYYRIHMPDGIKTVHRLIALTFIPNPDNLETVDHIDEDKTNNSVSNLRWMDRGENKSRSWSKRCRCIEDGLEFSNQAEAARYYGISPGQLSRVLNGQRNHTHGLHFERI